MDFHKMPGVISFKKFPTTLLRPLALMSLMPAIVVAVTAISTLGEVSSITLTSESASTPPVCHPECIGCTGTASNECNKCRNYKLYNEDQEDIDLLDIDSFTAIATRPTTDFTSGIGVTTEIVPAETSDTIVTELTFECVSICPESYYGDGNSICQPCFFLFTRCTGPSVNEGTSCHVGKYRYYNETWTTENTTNKPLTSPDVAEDDAMTEATITIGTASITTISKITTVTSKTLPTTQSTSTMHVPRDSILQCLDHCPEGHFPDVNMTCIKCESILKYNLTAINDTFGVNGCSLCKYAFQYDSCIKHCTDGYTRSESGDCTCNTLIVSGTYCATVGVIVGVACGIAIALAVIIATVICCILRRRRKHATPADIAEAPVAEEGDDNMNISDDVEAKLPGIGNEGFDRGQTSNSLTKEEYGAIYENLQKADRLPFNIINKHDDITNPRYTPDPTRKHNSPLNGNFHEDVTVEDDTSIDEVYENVEEDQAAAVRRHLEEASINKRRDVVSGPYATSVSGTDNEKHEIDTLPKAPVPPTLNCKDVEEKVTVSVSDRIAQLSKKTVEHRPTHLKKNSDSPSESSLEALPIAPVPPVLSENVSVVDTNQSYPHITPLAQQLKAGVEQFSKKQSKSKTKPTIKTKPSVAAKPTSSVTPKRNVKEISTIRDAYKKPDAAANDEVYQNPDMQIEDPDGNSPSTSDIYQNPDDIIAGGTVDDIIAGGTVDDIIAGGTVDEYDDQPVYDLPPEDNIPELEPLYQNQGVVEQWLKQSKPVTK